MRTSICLTCKKEFKYQPSQQDGKYCSQKCYAAARTPRKLLVCENCGKEFYRKNGLIKAHVFCSNSCRAKKYSNQVKIVCKVCGKVFYRRESIAKNYNIKCCSKICQGIAKRNRVKRICKGCGKEFEIKVSAANRSVERGKYCSKECYTEFSRGKNSHMYDHGQTFFPYCEKFDDRLKERVRYLHDNKCCICGSSKEQNHNKRMDVHHVFIEKEACCETRIQDKDWVRHRLPKHIARFGNPEFSEDEIIYIRMMVPLCMSCHSKVHGEESNDMPYEKTKWRKQFAELILNRFNGVSYLSKEEYEKIKKGS